MKVIVLTADANTLVYHRGDLIRDLAACGCEVVTSAAEDYPHVTRFVEDAGGRHRAIRMVRSRVSLGNDMDTFVDMWRLFRSEKPDALFAYTIKSVVYGCVVAAFAGVPRIYALLPGLGFTFVRPTTLKGRMVSAASRALHRFALKRADVIFMQNQDDFELLTELRILPKGVPAFVTAGSGVNVAEYPFVPLDQDKTLAGGVVRFALVSRLLISKGVVVFAEAARKIKAAHPNAEFHLIGPFDPNPNRVDEQQVAQWVGEGILTHHGMVRDVAGLLKDMHVFVLPTWYREGVPHATLEALSMGRPVITTDSVGARETVRLTPQGETQRKSRAPLREGHNGFLVEPQNVDAVAQAMDWYLRHLEAIPAHGRESRRLAEEVFDVRLVNALILREMGLEQAASRDIFPNATVRRWLIARIAPMQPSTSIVTAPPTTLTRVGAVEHGEALQAYTASAPVAPPAYYHPPPTAPAAPPAEMIISVADIFGYLRRYGKVACLVALPLAALAFVYLGFGTKVYEAESKLLIHIQATNPIQFVGANTNTGGITELSAPQIINNHRTGLKTRRYTDYLFSKLPQAQMSAFLADAGKLGMKSRLMIALRLAPAPKPAQPEELFAQKIDLAARVEPVKDSHILRVMIRDSDPDSAAAMANAYVENYIHYVSDDALQSTRQNSEVLQRQGEEIMEKLSAAERKLQDYVRNADLIKLNANGDMGTQRAESLTRAVTEADLDLLKATINLNSLRTAATRSDDAVGIKGVTDDPQIVDLRRRLDEARAKRSALEEWCGRLHPRMIALERDVLRLEQQVSDSLSSRVNEVLQAAEVEEKRARSQDEQLRAQLTQARGAALAEGSKENQLSLLSDEVSGLRDLYNQVTRSQKQANIASEFKDNGQLTVADIAVPPDSPISPKKSIALIAGMMVFGLVGLGMPVGLGLAHDHLLPVIKGAAKGAQPPAAPPQGVAPAAASPFTASAPPPPEPLPPPAQQPSLRIPQPSASATPILATLPELMSGEGPIQLGELLHPSAMSGGGAISRIIAHLEKQTIFRSGPGIVFITSANIGEGKSLLSAALAASLCTTGRRVFLMECNPAAPSIMNWFPQASGYSSWTNELETLRYGHSNLFLLPAHDLPSYEVSDLVDGYRAWIEKARPQVDWIIMDGSSLLRGFADVAQLCPFATDVLFVHDATRCSPEQVRAALNLLRPLATAETMRGMVTNRQSPCGI